MHKMHSQNVLAVAMSQQPSWHSTAHTCEIWDLTNARFNQCAFPFIAAFSTITSTLLFVARLLAPLLRRARPAWSQPFVAEEKVHNTTATDAAFLHGVRSSWPRSCLLGFSVVGLAATVCVAFYPHVDVPSMLLAVSWAVTILLIAIHNGRSFSFPLFVNFAVILATSVITDVDRRTPTTLPTIGGLVSCTAALAAVAVQFVMPMRDPTLPVKGIGKPGEEPTHDLRSPEDNLTFWQWCSVSWMSQLLARAKTKQLNDEDVWSLSHQFQHRQLHDKFRELRGSVLRRLMIANGADLVIVTVLMLTYQAATFAVPVLLQQLLRAWQDASASRTSIIKYAILILVARLFYAQVGVLALWFGRRAYERARGEMITMLYEKTLSRKIVTSQESTEKSVKIQEEPDTGDDSPSEQSEEVPSFTIPYVKSILRFVSLPFEWMMGTGKKSDEQKKPASLGKILNLMRNDVYEVAQRFWEIDRLSSAPIGIVWATVLVWRLIGPSCLIGVLTTVVAQVVTLVLAKLLLRWEKIRRSATDARLQVTSQTIESIRHLRWYGWQSTWVDKIMSERQRELNLKIITRLWTALIGFVDSFAGGAFPVAAFSAYTALAGQPLRIEIAFPALHLFALLEMYLTQLPGLITVWLNAVVALGRIESFMSEADKVEIDEDRASYGELALQDASFAWPGISTPVLHHLNLTMPLGLTVICGKVGAGKSALLQALLGELDLLDGKLVNANEMVAYCGQTPWLESMSIRENILFAAPFEEARYKQVLDVCALTPDLADFKHGDLSNIGENGIGLSGGQKARVALARAFYSRADTLLLDDPISALDHNTAESIVRNAFGGQLLHGRRVVLVTHRTELCAHLASQVLEVEDGTARQITQEAARAKGLQMPTSTTAEHVDDQPDEKTKEEQEAAAVPEKFIEDEHRAKGSVQASVYWQFIRAGKLKWWLLDVAGLVAYRLVNLGKTWLLKQWGEAYDSPAFSAKGLFGNLPNPEQNLRPWLITFLLIVVGYSVLYLVSQMIRIVIIYTTGRRLFASVIDKVTHATFRYYDITPVGRLMNRLTSDIGTVDGNISSQFHDFVFNVILWVTSVVIIGSITPVFLVFTAIITVTFVLIFRQFIPASQNLRRLEMVSLSPLMTNFGALLDGLMTVRAYGAQGRFQARNIAVVDSFQKMDHFYWNVQEWLMFRFDILAALTTFVLTLLALYTHVSAGLTAFVLSIGGSFVTSTHNICRIYGQIEMDFTSVERVVELLHLDQEHTGTVQPPAAWPSTAGDIVFEDVTIKYAPHLDPALSNVSFRIKGGSNTAIVGRTGSGKSTLAVALLATVLPTSGRILIDGIDIATLDPDVLRKRVTFLAQDPLLFEGTIRANLDPLNENTDDECAAALDRVCGSTSSGAAVAEGSSSHAVTPTSHHQSAWTLSTRVESGGKNFSQGQRQLVGLARAVLRRSAIIILDEATASIDLETSMRIQQVLREEMAQSTVLTIAHRVEAVQGADGAVVLAKGKVVEVREGSGGA